MEAIWRSPERTLSVQGLRIGRRVSAQRLRAETHPARHRSDNQEPGWPAGSDRALLADPKENPQWQGNPLPAQAKGYNAVRAGTSLWRRRTAGGALREESEQDTRSGRPRAAHAVPGSQR